MNRNEENANYMKGNYEPHRTESLAFRDVASHP